MPIRLHLSEGCVFEPEAIRAMSAAFEVTCVQLRISEGDQRSREIIATRIIDLARNGVLDAAALHRRVVAEASVSA